MSDLVATRKKFKDVVKAIGIQKEELDGILASGGTAAKKKSALDKLAAASKKLGKLMAETQVSEAERQRKISELELNIEIDEILLATETDFGERMRVRRRLTRRKASLGTLKAPEVFRFDQLLDADGNELAELLEEADRDIRSRQNLQRVLKGVEVLLRVGVFGAALTAKMATAAV